MKPTLQLVRPPSTPEEMDSHSDVFFVIGWIAAAMLLILLVGALVATVFSLVKP